MNKKFSFLYKVIFYFSKVLKDLRFAVFILFLIALISSLGSIIEQDQEDNFYKLNYPDNKPLYGILSSRFIFFFSLNHLYQSWYFLFLLILLALSLFLCSLYNQLPLVKRSRKFFFKIKANYFQNQKEILKIQSEFFEKENILLKIKRLNFYIYQNKSFLYAYRALIGRLSPIFVHISLILLLFSSFLSSFQNFKAEEILVKGEISHLQNIISTGNFSRIPKINLRLNDFWINYQNKKIKQFYSNLSLLDNYSKEEITKTISVNKPLIYKDLNIYQSDWNIISLRLLDSHKSIIEYPLFFLDEKKKLGITWVYNNSDLPLTLQQEKSTQYIIIFDQLRNSFLVYDEKGKFLQEEQINSLLFDHFRIIESIKASGLLIKYDPTIFLIYFSFLLLIFTTFLSFLPYERLCVYTKSKTFLLFSGKNNDLNSSSFVEKFFIEN